MGFIAFMKNVAYLVINVSFARKKKKDCHASMGHGLGVLPIRVSKN
jgi:hypothetical protein